MTVQLQIGGMKDGDAARRKVQADVRALGRQARVDFAQISLHWQAEVMPPCQALGMLALPGRVIRAAARDHTWPAAWSKVLGRLRAQVLEAAAASRPRKRLRAAPAPQPTF